MRRLAAIDWILLGSTLPILLIGLVTSVVHGVRGDFVVAPFWATSAVDRQSYPIVAQTWSYPSGETSPLAVGDRLLTVDASDLRGASQFALIQRWSQAARAGARSLLLTIERGGVRSDVRVALAPGQFYPPGNAPWWACFTAGVSLAGTALLLLLRATHWHLARRNYVATLLLASFTTPWLMAPISPWGEVISDALILPLAFALLLWNLNEFLPGLRLWGPGQRTVAWALVLLQSASMAVVFWLPDLGLATMSTGLAWAGFAIAFLVALARVYYHADPRGRRQIKWVMYGFYVAWCPNLLAPFIWPSPAYTASEWNDRIMVVAILSYVAMPLGMLVAVAYYQFLDIDRLFSATLSYSVLAIVGLAMVLGVMPAAERAASDVLGLDPTIGQLLMSLVLAAVLVPAYRFVRPRIDRWLFPERATLQQGFDQLLGEIQGLGDVHELTRLVGERLDALLRPAVVVLYAHTGDVFAPLTARGRGGLPTFATRSALIAALRERTTPLAAKRWTARQAASLTPFERAALETLDAAVLVPIRRGADLVALWCLGPKRSGDIYTPTDLALLGAVAGAVSDRLLALGETWSARQTSPFDSVWDSPEPRLARIVDERTEDAPCEPQRERSQNHLTQDEEQSSVRPEERPSFGGVSKPVPSPVEGGVLSEAGDFCVFRQEGEYWTLAYRGKTARLRGTKGLNYIARLLAQPGCDVHVRDLAAIDASGRAGNGSGAVCVEADLGTVLDARATAEYKERLAEARQELEEASAAGDLGQATRLQQEIETITDQLTATYGLGGRARTAGDPAERARKAVTNQIRRALDRIGVAHPELGRHLGNALRTGFLCAYRPEHPVVWRL
jgi:hypothetical protein